ncbi:hypothetical protein [Hymenobacter sp. CRA2]|uniref:hypothetical protein n=1 Tax=Hymenobacter sp. CRA2 TaxID=1955620 RepID=UPI0011172F4A|nr:hypothetical protein [Hymenobacter sp. CRA2]
MKELSKQILRSKTNLKEMITSFGHTQSITKKWISFCFTAVFCLFVALLHADFSHIETWCMLAVALFFIYFNYTFSLTVSNVYLYPGQIRIENVMHGDIYFDSHEFIQVKINFFYSYIIFTDYKFKFYYVPGFIQSALLANVRDAETKANKFIKTKTSLVKD